VWWALALGVALVQWPRERIPWTAVAAGGLLAALAGLAGLSMIWADSSELAFDEANRTALYLGVFALAVVVARRGDARRWVDGLALGIVAVVLLALVARLLPGLIEAAEPPASFADDLRPSYPLGYWNGLAVMSALALPLLLRRAVAERAGWARGLALAPGPALVCLIYLTNSRGGTIAAAAGVIAFVLLTDGRVRAAAAGVVAALGSAAAIVALNAHPVVVDGPLASAAADEQGAWALAEILGLCLVTGIVWALVSRRPLRIRMPSRRVRLAAIVAILGLSIAGVAAADPARRFETFKEPPPPVGVHPTEGPYANTGFARGGSSGRWQLWSGAVEQWKSHPIIGGGAGSFASWWAQHSSITHVARDAHSLYAETLGELGLTGAVLLLSLLAIAVVAVRSRVRGAQPRERATVAAVAGVAVAFGVGAGVDWMWELTAIGLIGMVALGLLAGPATCAAGERAARPRRNFAARAGFVGIGLLIVVAQAIPLLAQTEIQNSREAAAAGDHGGALTHARDARSWQPWASSPYMQLALVHEEAGRLAKARAAIRRAIDRDPSDWRPWLVSARIGLTAGLRLTARADFRRALELNPRSRLLASLKPAVLGQDTARK
jgi:hypothetical protein